MKGFSIAVLLVFLMAVSGCTGREKEKVQEKPAKMVQKLNIDMDTEKRYQDAADKGYQPWKRDAVEVAKECLINNGVGSSSGECRVLSQDPANAVVRVNTKDGAFNISLKRLVKPDGIWTATMIEKEE